MYHAFVRRRVRAMFNAINAGKAASVLVGFSHDFEHICTGQHALAGRRTQFGPMVDWYARMCRLLPDIRFTITRITVSGGPWKTLAVVEWTLDNPNGVVAPSNNAGVHMIRLCWGRMVQVIICPYGDALSAPLDELARAGVAEAGAAPIA